jgi:hypothetical protein
VRCHVTQPLGFGARSTVGALSSCGTGQVLFTVGCASDSAALTLRALFLCQPPFVADRCASYPLLRWCTGKSGGTPDGPVNYSGVSLLKPESGWFNPVRAWCTGHCPVAHRTVRCARPQHTWFLLLR